VRERREKGREEKEGRGGKGERGRKEEGKEGGRGEKGKRQGKRREGGRRVEGQPWVPVGSTVGPRFLAGIRGSPQKIRQRWVQVALW